MKREDAAPQPDGGGNVWSPCFVASEVAMTLMLLIATGLMVKSANHLWQIDPGFDPQRLLTMTISLPNNKFEWRHNVVFSRQVIGAIEAMPGVRGAAVIQGVPMRAGSFFTAFSIEGRPDTPVDRPSGRLRVVSPGYFGVMHIPILSAATTTTRRGGRRGKPSIRHRESHTGRAFLAGPGCCRQRVRMSWKSSPSTIIGVVGDVRYTGLDADAASSSTCPKGCIRNPRSRCWCGPIAIPCRSNPDVHRRIATSTRTRSSST